MRSHLVVLGALVAAVTWLAATPGHAAPLPLVQIDFNDAAGNQSVDNHGTAVVAPVFSGDTAAFSNDFPSTHSGGWSGNFNSVGDSGNDKVDLGDLNAVDGASKLTLTAWVKGSAFHANGSRVIAKSNATGSGFEFSVLSGSSGGPDGYPAFGAGGSLISASSHIGDLGGRIPIDQWRFVAVTYDSTSAADNLTWYVGDGTTLNSATDSFPVGPVGSNALPLLIGNYRFAGRAFRGQIDNARVYTDVLAPSEMMDVMTFDDPLAIPEPTGLMLTIIGIASISIQTAIRRRIIL